MHGMRSRWLVIPVLLAVVTLAVPAVAMGLTYRGPAKFNIGGKNPFPHSPHVRLVMRGSPLLVGLLGHKGSPFLGIYYVRRKRKTRAGAAPLPVLCPPPAPESPPYGGGQRQRLWEGQLPPAHNRPLLLDRGGERGNPYGP